MQIQFFGPRTRRFDCAVTLALPSKGALSSRGHSGGSYTHSVYRFHPLDNSFFVDVDGEERVQGSRVKRTRIESACEDSMAALVYDCFSAEVIDDASLPNPQNYKQAMKQTDASKWTELELQQLAGCLKVFSESDCYLRELS